jgi:hypothetical protein
LEFFAVIIFAKAAEYAASIISMQRKLEFNLMTLALCILFIDRSINVIKWHLYHSLW